MKREGTLLCPCAAISIHIHIYRQRTPVCSCANIVEHIEREGEHVLYVDRDNTRTTPSCPCAAIFIHIYRDRARYLCREREHLCVLVQPYLYI